MNTLLFAIAGLIGLSIVVVIHEFGHFLAAKFFKIEVEAFSVGMGPKLFGFKIKGTEYKLSAFPIGGYCKMKGEAQFQKALETNDRKVMEEPGSLFAVAPWKRIIVALAGPLFNLVSAILFLAIVYAVGFETPIYPAKVLVVPQTQEGVKTPAAISGMMDGDVILKINEKPIKSFQDVRMQVARLAEKDIKMTVLRNGEEVIISIKPLLNKKTGGGMLGIEPYFTPDVYDIIKDSPVQKAGLQKGDIITAIENQPVVFMRDLENYILKNKPSIYHLTVKRSGETVTLKVYPDYNNDSVLGITIPYTIEKSPEYNFITAFKPGTQEAMTTLQDSVLGLGLLFKNIDLNEAMAGPIRIIGMSGELTVNSFKEGFVTGIVNFLRWWALISIVLFFMNLLPIPALDGGLILVSIIEIISRKGLSPKAMYRYQMVGFVIIIALTVLIMGNDIIYYIKH